MKLGVDYFRKISYKGVRPPPDKKTIKQKHEMNTQEKISALRAFANENYSSIKGMDWICECWGTEEMTSFVEGEKPAATVEQLQRKLKKIARAYASRESDAMSGAF